LGEISGPLQSSYGHHLVLVCERTNCPKLDGENTRVVRGSNGYTTVLSPPVEGEKKSIEQQAVEVSLNVLIFWVGVSLSGGIFAELLTKAVSSIETLP
jgi:hypothetical protein